MVEAVELGDRSHTKKIQPLPQLLLRNVLILHRAICKLWLMMGNISMPIQIGRDYIDNGGADKIDEGKIDNGMIGFLCIDSIYK